MSDSRFSFRMLSAVVKLWARDEKPCCGQRHRAEQQPVRYRGSRRGALLPPARPSCPPPYLDVFDLLQYAFTVAGHPHNLICAVNEIPASASQSRVGQCESPALEDLLAAR